MSKKFLIITLLLVLILVTQISTTIYAATIDLSKTASLTIVEYENAYGKEKNNSENIPLSGVDITIYKLDEANYNNTAEKIQTDLNNGAITLVSQTLTTGENGTIKFSNLELGRYLVVQSNSPANVSVKMESFLIDLPRTSDDGTAWNYDVTVEPKNITVYGDVALTKTSNTGDALQGTTWELQVKNTSENWEKYNYEGTLTTDENGQISVSNLPAGNYRFVETSTLNGYILDSSDTKEFTVSSENTSHTLTATNEKIDIEKQVKLSDGYGKAVGAYLTDSIEWKITANVPTIINKMNTFYITDVMPDGLDLVQNSLIAYNGNTQTPLTLNTDYTITQENKTIKIEFITNNLSNINSIYCIYKTTFNSSVEYGKSLQNSANLTYTNNIDVNGNCISTNTTNSSLAEVHTGSIVILKTDVDNNPLQGARFKISRTHQDAKDNKFIQDKNGNDLIATSDSDGLIKFYGLKYGIDDISAESANSSYFITEIESPTYEENGEIKHYNLLSDSVEVTVNSNSGVYSANSPIVINKKGFTLPITGTTGTISLIAIGSFFILIAIKRKKQNDKTQIKEN